MWIICLVDIDLFTQRDPSSEQLQQDSMDDKKRPVVGSSFCLNPETDDAHDGGNADADDAGDPYI